MNTAWYLGHSADDVGRSAVLVGDPDRIDRIAQHMRAPEFLPVKRGLRTVSGIFAGQKVTAAAFGMGSPIACIVMTELSMLGVTRFMRVGTALFFPPAQAGDFLLCEGIRSHEGTSPSYVDDVNKATASPVLNKHARRVLGAESTASHTGTFATFDAFYRDMFPLDNQSIERVSGICQSLADAQVIAADMETSALVNTASRLDVEFTSLCIATVDAHTREKLDRNSLAEREGRMFELALKTLTNSTEVAT